MPHEITRKLSKFFVFMEYVEYGRVKISKELIFTDGKRIRDLGVKYCPHLTAVE